MTRSSTTKLAQPLEDHEQLFRSSRKLTRTLSVNYLNSSEFNTFLEEKFEVEESTEIMTEPQWKNHDHNPRGLRTEDEDPNEHIEKVLDIADLFDIPNVTQYQVMLRAFPMSLTGAASRWLRNEPSSSIQTWETLKKRFLEVVLFYKALNVPTRQILDSKGVIPSMKAAEAKKAIQEMADRSQKWHDGTSNRIRSTDTKDGLDAIQA
ncbi:hypothetical protein Tco_1541423 [Tanacetum coccineum]